MSPKSTTDWLAELQARFSSVLRTPLDRSTGTLRAAMDHYDPRACEEILPGALQSTREALAVYNRQYWFRLFTLLQNEFRLTGRLVGLWHFNELANRFLLERPPSHYDLHDAASGFEAFLTRALPERGLTIGGEVGVVPRAALLEGVSIDAAFRQVFMAPAEARFQPSADDAAKLPQARLVPSVAFALLEEHWPLLRLRHELLADGGERAVKVPAPYADGPHWWAVVRVATGQRVLPLVRLQARLLRLLSSHSVGDALGMLETECSAEERASLATHTQQWLAESVQLGFWSGFVESKPQPSERSTP